MSARTTPPFAARLRNTVKDRSTVRTSGDGGHERDALSLTLPGVQLSAAQGEFVTLLGAGGSGKTALMQLLSGARRAGSGELTAGGVDLRGTPTHRRGFGVVAQDDALFPRLSLAQNVAYPLKRRGVRRAQRTALVEAALDAIGLSDSGRLPHQASMAECQRAAIARATVFAPAVLLLDDPLSRQGATERPVLLAALRRLQLLLGATTIMATRVAGDAMALSDRVVVLDQGRIVQSGAPAAVYDQPSSAIAALACGEANLLPGIVRAIDEEDGLARVGLACGPAAEGLAAPGLRVRDECLFCLRPERIAVAATTAAEMSEAALDATVLEALNLGESIRLRLLLGNGQAVLVIRPAAAGLRGLRPGQGVAIAWQPHAAHVLAAHATP
jgi:putative spermidine/putrescine transport system ATP-binding protein